MCIEQKASFFVLEKEQNRSLKNGVPEYGNATEYEMIDLTIISRIKYDEAQTLIPSRFYSSQDLVLQRDVKLKKL